MTYPWAQGEELTASALNESFEEVGSVKDPITRENNITYYAEHSCMVVINGNYDTLNTGANSFVTDSSATPTTVYWSFSPSQNEERGTISITIPVKKGNYYKLNATAGVINWTSYFEIPISNV